MNCPKCDSNKIQKSQLESALFITGGCLMIIPIIGWIIAPIIMIGAIVMSLKKGKRVQCIECKHQWFVSKERFIEWNNSIKLKEKNMQ